MAIRIPIITDLQDQGIKNAKIAFGNFKTAVRDAEGGLGKFKAGATSIMDSVQAHAGAFAIAGGLAFGAWVKSGIDAFKDLALEADKYATATGLSIGDASRWIEHAGDIGVPIDAVATAIEKMNLAVGKNPNQFKDLGVDLEYTNTGALDVNATFLNTIQHLKDIKDPAQRAKEGVKLLGRGWTAVARLIDEGSTTISDSLAKVSEAKVISPEELKKAKEYRDAMDNLGDKMEDVKIKAGETSIPILTTLTNIAGYLLDAKGLYDSFIKGAGDSVKDVASTIGEGFKDIFGGLFDSADQEPIVVYAENMRLAREDTRQFIEITKKARETALGPLKVVLNDTWKEIKNVDQAWKDLTGRLEVDVAIDNAKTSIDDLREAAVKAFSTGSQEDLANYRQKLLDATTSIENLALTMDDSSSHQVKILVDKGDLEGALALIGQIKAFQTTYGNVSDIGAAIAGANKMVLPPGIDFSGFKASGGSVQLNKSYIVGERGPELFTPGTSGNITPNNALGNNANITVNVNGGDPNSIVRALQQYVRQSGPVPLNTRAM